MDVFRIEGGNGTERARIEQGPGDESGEGEGKIWRPRHDEVKIKPLLLYFVLAYAIYTIYCFSSFLYSSYISLRSSVDGRYLLPYTYQYTHIL